MNLDNDLLDTAYRDFTRNAGKNNIEAEYLHFSQFIQHLYIRKNGYIIGTGNFRNANYELVRRIKRNMERHPILFKLFWKYFMVG